MSARKILLAALLLGVLAAIAVGREPTGSAALDSLLAGASESDIRISRDPRDPQDPVTLAHELCHLRVSKASTPGERGFLVDGVLHKFPNPRRTTLSHIAEAIPERDRGVVFKTYMLDYQRDWQNFPLIVLDELLAYSEGALVRAELGIKGRYDTVIHAGEVAVYAKYMVDEIKRREPASYPSRKLETFFLRTLDRLRLIDPGFDTLPAVRGFNFLQGERRDGEDH